MCDWPFIFPIKYYAYHRHYSSKMLKYILLCNFCWQLSKIYSTKYTNKFPILCSSCSSVIYFRFHISLFFILWLYLAVTMCIYSLFSIQFRCTQFSIRIPKMGVLSLKLFLYDYSSQPKQASIFSMFSVVNFFEHNVTYNNLNTSLMASSPMSSSD